MAGPEDADYLLLLDQLPFSLGAESPTDVGRIYRVLLIKIERDPPKPLPGTNQYPINKPFQAPSL